jgi:2,3-bisphosphoglycerate-independent phosphoglycerate mutase
VEKIIKHTVLIFVDGLGWSGEEATRDPRKVYGGDFFKLPPNSSGSTIPIAGNGFAKPVDAILGVDGVPQSATGQTSLFTGVNAQAAIGQHLAGFPNAELREILLEKSILKKFKDNGLRSQFINAYRPIFFEISRERQLTLSATTVANLAAGLPFHTLDEMEAGEALYQEFTHQELIDRGFDVKLRTPGEAGAILARQSQFFDFTLFEYFQTDRAGHSMDMDRACDELRRLDEFLSRLLEDMESAGSHDTLVLLTSDHGNIEDLSTKRHTLNPVPLMAWGREASEFLDKVEGLDDVTGAILARHAIT